MSDYVQLIQARKMALRRYAFTEDKRHKEYANECIRKARQLSRKGKLSSKEHVAAAYLWSGWDVKSWLPPLLHQKSEQEFFLGKSNKEQAKQHAQNSTSLELED